MNPDREEKTGQRHHRRTPPAPGYGGAAPFRPRRRRRRATSPLRASTNRRQPPTPPRRDDVDLVLGRWCRHDLSSSPRGSLVRRIIAVLAQVAVHWQASSSKRRPSIRETAVSAISDQTDAPCRTAQPPLVWGDDELVEAEHRLTDAERRPVPSQDAERPSRRADAP